MVTKRVQSKTVFCWQLPGNEESIKKKKKRLRNITAQASDTNQLIAVPASLTQLRGKWMSKQQQTVDASQKKNAIRKTNAEVDTQKKVNKAQGHQ